MRRLRHCTANFMMDEIVSMLSDLLEVAEFQDNLNVCSVIAYATLRPYLQFNKCAKLQHHSRTVTMSGPVFLTDIVLKCKVSWATSSPLRIFARAALRSLVSLVPPVRPNRE